MVSSPTRSTWDFEYIALFPTVLQLFQNHVKQYFDSDDAGLLHISVFYNEIACQSYIAFDVESTTSMLPHSFSAYLIESSIWSLDADCDLFSVECSNFYLDRRTSSGRSID